MDLATQYRLRVQNCLGTIIDVHRSIGGEQTDRLFVSEFEKLRSTVEHLDMTLVCEGDVLMVEEATNALLGEFRCIFRTGTLGRVYEQLLN